MCTHTDGWGSAWLATIYFPRLKTTKCSISLEAAAGRAFVLYDCTLRCEVPLRRDQKQSFKNILALGHPFTTHEIETADSIMEAYR